MKRILIIEDEKPLREAYAMVLEQEGFKIGTAENGQAGIKKLRSFKPDLIILDMLMPVMDGLGFLKSAELTTRYPNTKTIIISNLSDAITDTDSQKYGVAGTFVKVNLSPLDLATVAKQYCA